MLLLLLSGSVIVNINFDIFRERAYCLRPAPSTLRAIIVCR